LCTAVINLHLLTGRGVYRAARFRDGRLEGCLFIGPGPEEIQAAAAFAAAALSGREATALLAGAAAGEDPGPLVGACSGVGQRAIRAAVADSRAACAASIGRLLKAGTNCGSCLPEIQTLLAHEPADPTAMRSMRPTSGQGMHE
jgi:assimilatory nitrate reductase catalytic subunit